MPRTVAGATACRKAGNRLPGRDVSTDEVRTSRGSQPAPWARTSGGPDRWSIGARFPSPSSSPWQASSCSSSRRSSPRKAGRRSSSGRRWWASRRRSPAPPIRQSSAACRAAASRGGWTSARASSPDNGHLEIKVRGLVLASGANAGSNPVGVFRGLVSCLTTDASRRQRPNRRLPGHARGRRAPGGGNADIEADLNLPNPCIAPIVFVTSGGGVLVRSDRRLIAPR